MSKKSQKGCKVFLIEHSITRLKVAAIVDFEQTGDLTGGMLHDLIHKAGGPQLEAECREKTYPKLLNTGEAVLTGAHGIRDVQGIIHTVYPILVDGLSKYEAKALVECHDNALRIACGSRLRTVAFACLHYEVPNRTDIESTLNAVKGFLDQNGSSEKLDAVLFCSRDTEETNAYRQLMAKCFPDMNFDVHATKASKAYRLTIPKSSPASGAGTNLAGMCSVASAEGPLKSNDTVDDNVKTIVEKNNDYEKTIVERAGPRVNRFADLNLTLDAEYVRHCKETDGLDAGVHAFDASAATPSEPSFKAPSVPSLPPHRARKYPKKSTKGQAAEQVCLVNKATAETGTGTMISRTAPNYEYAEAVKNSYAQVPPDASLARIVSGSRTMQQAPYANSQQQSDSICPSVAVFSADDDNRFFKQTNPEESKYHLGDQIGQGAFGKVFEAWLREDEDCHRKRAIKHVNTCSKKDYDRHIQEAQIMLQFRHPYLLGCYEVYTYENGCTYNVFVVMDCMSYGSLDVILAEMLDNGAFFSEQSARYILYCCTQALAFLHTSNIIHRDVKSANILVSNDGRAKLGDFGLSGNLDQGAGTSIVGTPRYMAPEIARKFVEYNSEAYTKEVDVFSLGVVGIELACGELPHRERTKEEVCADLCDEEFPNWLLHEMNESLTNRKANWSNDYRQFVKNCLVYEACQRMKAVDLLNLGLFTSVYS